MERRLAVHAGADAAQAVIRRAQRIWIAAAAAVVLAGAAGTADARPKRRDAKAAFDRGVVAYQKANFQGAADALRKSFELEHDVDTLFAWAQAERKLDHCDKAIELYDQLLTLNLPPANRTVVEGKLAECRTVVAQQAPPPPVAPPPPREPAVTAPVAPPPREPPVAPPPREAPVAPPSPVVTAPAPVGTPPETPPGEPRPYAFYKDPVALGLLGAAVVAGGVGVGYLAGSRSAENAAKKATTYQQVQSDNDKVDQRNKIGVGGLIAGGVLLGGGVGWILWKHHDSGERRTVTGWLAPGGGGLVISGPL